MPKSFLYFPLKTEIFKEFYIFTKTQISLKKFIYFLKKEIVNIQKFKYSKYLNLNIFLYSLRTEIIVHFIIFFQILSKQKFWQIS